MSNSKIKQTKLYDFKNTLLIKKKSSIFHQIYYRIIQIPFFYKYKKVVKYLSVGVMSTITDFSLLFILTTFFGLFYLFSNIISLFCSIIVKYVLDRKYTFKSETYHIKYDLVIFSKYLLISLSSVIIITVLMAFFVELLGIHYMLAKIIATWLSLVFNYNGHKFCFNANYLLFNYKFHK